MTNAAPDADTERLRRDWAGNVDNRVQAALIGVVALLAMLYAPAMQGLVAALGLRRAAFVLGAVAALSAVRSGRSGRRPAHAAAAALGLASAATARPEPLLLLPALLYVVLASAFLASLRDGPSMVERAAKAIQPAAPDFIAPYCRGATAAWGFVFAVNAGLLAVVAVAATEETWRRVAGPGLWTGMAVLAAAEFLVRKTYFRNYWYGGPFERLWSRLFPAEATEMGRRSAAHIRDVRRKLGLDD